MSDSAGVRVSRVAPVALVAGLVGTLILALTLSGTLSALTAGITNTVNTAASPRMAITETGPDGTVAHAEQTCNSWDGGASCATINKYGGVEEPLIPGAAARQTVVTFTNNGSAPVSTHTLTPQACVASAVSGSGGSAPGTSAADNLCFNVNVLVERSYDNGGAWVQVYNGSAQGFAGAQTDAHSVAVSGTVQYRFSVSIPASAPDAVAGQQISQPLAWAFSS